mgnify:CR=1 FL=1
MPVLLATFSLSLAMLPEAFIVLNIFSALLGVTVVLLEREPALAVGDGVALGDLRTAGAFTPGVGMRFGIG